MSRKLIVDETVPVEIVTDNDSNNKINELIGFLHKAGIDVLSTILREMFNCRITNLKNSGVALEKRRRIAIDAILCERALNNDETKANTIIEKYFAVKPKKEKNNDWLEKFEVGEEVLIYHSHDFIKGRINKINKNSLTIELFAYSVIIDEEAIKNQTHGYNRLIWHNHINNKVIRYNTDGIVKKGESKYYDELFIEGKRSVDYGY